MNATVAPATGDPPASATSTTTESGSAAPARARCPSPDATVSAAAAWATSTSAVALRPSNDAVSVPEPFATAVTVPPASTVNTPESLLAHAAEPE